MEDLLWIKGMYYVTLGLDATQLANNKYGKWLNHNDESIYFGGMSIYEDLKIHIQCARSMDKV
jgi:hypothetical protein